MITDETLQAVVSVLKQFFGTGEFEVYPSREQGAYDVLWDGWGGPIPWPDLVSASLAIDALLPDEVRVYAESDTRLSVHPRMVRLEVIE